MVYKGSWGVQREGVEEQMRLRDVQNVHPERLK